MGLLGASPLFGRSVALKNVYSKELAFGSFAYSSFANPNNNNNNNSNVDTNINTISDPDTNPHRSRTIKTYKGGISGLKGKLPDKLPNITGDWSVDGLTRYETDLFDSVSWVSNYFKLMNQDLSKHKNKFIYPDLDHKLVSLEDIYEYTYDFSKPHPRNSNCVIRVSVPSLNLDGEASQRLRHLAGDNYDPKNDLIEITITTPEERSLASVEDEWVENRYQAFGALQSLIKIAKNPKLIEGLKDINNNDADKKQIDKLFKSLSKKPIFVERKRETATGFPEHWKLN